MAEWGWAALARALGIAYPGVPYHLTSREELSTSRLPIDA